MTPLRSKVRCEIAALLAVFFLGGCASLAPPVQRVDQITPEGSGDTEIEQNVRELLADAKDESAAVYLQNGVDAFAARLAAVERSSRSVDAQYYLFHNDVTGNLFAERLLTAAQRGIQVRLLLDDMGTQGQDDYLLALDAHPNFDIRIFNPFANRKYRALEYLYRFGIVTRRMHNKSLIIDGAAAITGGRNIGDEYFDAHHQSNFLDMDVLIFGPAVTDVSAQFDQYWNSPLSYDIDILSGTEESPEDIQRQWQELHEFAESQKDNLYIETLRATPFLKYLNEKRLPISIGPTTVLVDLPQKVREPLFDDETHLGPALWEYFRESATELVILNPYFIPGEKGVDALAQAVARGCRVIVLTNSLAANDVAAVHGHYSKYRKPLIQAGVELYELKLDRPYSRVGQELDSAEAVKMGLHVKTFVFDREKTFIGSLNLDPRSVYQNTELGVIIDDAEMANEIATLALELLPDVAYRVELDNSGSLMWSGKDYETGEPIKLDGEPDAGIFLRLFAFVSRILPVESQL